MSSIGKFYYPELSPELMRQGRDNRDHDIGVVTRAAAVQTGKSDFISYADTPPIDTPAYRNLQIAIPRLPPRQTAAELGPEAVVWSACFAFSDYRQNTYRRSLERHTGYTLDEFDRAFTLSEDMTGALREDTRGADIIRQLRLSRAAHKVVEWDTPRLVKEHAAAKDTLTNEQVANYGLMSLRPHHVTEGPPEIGTQEAFPHSSTIDWNIYLDTSTGVALTYKQKPIAVLSVELAKKPDCLKLVQIQGVTGEKIQRKPNGRRIINPPDAAKVYPWELQPIDWRSLCITIAGTLAMQSGVDELRLQSAQNNRWLDGYYDRYDVYHPGIPLQAAIKSYDIPAQQNGFELGADGDWHRSSMRKQDS